ncbi:uncharacterized protein PHACADRAFT_201968 [Phanerochaete carnosa HHB-10118-sp]|uniref:Uncharacterized protein n=1 Tax=Phanerochaete carnosa (strain HHB-10118-sp) TaxID=650164 RepID=K5VQY0_PHACS|nr:uncharacterized protein PHACADRAFT_201968 [Phanerochaete carnosa HHB-10118-sp]EKM49150.1 hypothetical protein PHACADRAFT_201968 [Phanerochaete carnosa HHB-10118-sp]
MFVGTYLRSSPPPLPVHFHVHFRQILMLFYQCVISEAIDYGINEYLNCTLRDLLADPDPLNGLLISSMFQPTSEWTGNPFLYVVERLRLRQISMFYEDLWDKGDTDLYNALAAIHSILTFRVDGPDATVIPGLCSLSLS